MAEDYTDLTLDELRDVLAKKQEKLGEVRSLRLSAEQDAAERIQAAQLRAEIARVDGTINLEVSQLQVTLEQNPDAVGAGSLSVSQTNQTPAVTPSAVPPSGGNQVASEGASTNTEGGK